MIKIIAALAMLIDHAGLILFPQNEILRIIGRLSMPLFAYSLAWGYEQCRMKRAFPRYVVRMLVFAAVSQFPYRAMIGDGKTLNIGVTWLIALCVLALIDRKRYNEPDYPIPCAGAGILFAGAVLLRIIKTDYGIYGILLPAVFHYGIVKKQDYFKTFALMTALWGVYTVLYGGTILNGVGIACLPLIALSGRIKAFSAVRLPKWFYYAFYPVHITVLLLIKYFTKGA